MNVTRTLEARIRGWFPQEPAMGITKSANVNMKPTWSVALPFLASGVLMIIAAVVSAYFGLTLLNDLVVSVGAKHFHVDFARLYVGVLSLVSFGLDLFAALLLLLRKYVVLAEVLAVIVLACGLASPWIFTYFHSPLVYMYYETVLLNGLFVSSPMIAFSLATLILVRLNRKKLKQDVNMRWTALSFTVSGALMIIASVPFAYHGLSYLAYLVSVASEAANYGVNYYWALLMVLLYLLVFGADLFVAMLLLKRKRVGLAAVIVGVVLAIGLPLQFIVLRGAVDPSWAFDSPTIACLIATLILVGLNYRKFKQDTNANGAMENSARLKSEI